MESVPLSGVARLLAAVLTFQIAGCGESGTELDLAEVIRRVEAREARVRDRGYRARILCTSVSRVRILETRGEPVFETRKERYEIAREGARYRVCRWKDPAGGTREELDLACSWDGERYMLADRQGNVDIWSEDQDQFADAAPRPESLLLSLETEPRSAYLRGALEEGRLRLAGSDTVRGRRAVRLEIAWKSPGSRTVKFWSSCRRRPSRRSASASICAPE